MPNFIDSRHTVHCFSRNSVNLQNTDLTPSTNEGKCLKMIEILMKELNDALYRGMIYSKVPNGK